MAHTHTGDGNWTGTLSLHAGDADGTGGIVDNFAFEGGQLAAAEWSNHRLPYATPSLQQDVHLSGAATVRVRVASDAAAANLTVWLVSLPWTDGDDINDNIITKGWADPANAGAADIASPRSGADLTPGEFVELEFPLQPDDQVIPAGARIGLTTSCNHSKVTANALPIQDTSIPASDKRHGVTPLFPILRRLDQVH